MTGEYAKAQAEWAAIDRHLMKWAVPAIGGVIAAAGGLATGLYSLAIPGAGFSTSGRERTDTSSYEAQGVPEKDRAVGVHRLGQETVNE